MDEESNMADETTQAEIAQQEQQARAENPNAVIGRETNPAFGGESFDYGARS